MCIQTEFKAAVQYREKIKLGFEYLKQFNKLPLETWITYWNTTLPVDYMTLYLKSNLRVSNEERFAKLLKFFCCERNSLKEHSNEVFNNTSGEVLKLKRRQANQYLSKFRGKVFKYLPIEFQQHLKNVKSSQTINSTQSTKSKSQNSQSQKNFEDNRIKISSDVIYDDFSLRIPQETEQQSERLRSLRQRKGSNKNYISSPSTNLYQSSDLEADLESNDNSDEDFVNIELNDDDDDDDDDEDYDEEEETSQKEHNINLKDYDEFLDDDEKKSSDEKDLCFFLYIIVIGGLIKLGCSTALEAQFLSRYKMYYPDFEFKMFPFELEDLKGIPRHIWMHNLESYLFAKINELPLDKSTKLLFGSFINDEEEKASIEMMRQFEMENPTERYVFDIIC
jgi:hypothetical protein